VNPLLSFPLCPLTVTVTVTAPTLPAGVVAVIVVLFTTVTLVAATPPNVTIAPAPKFLPAIVTVVPPDVGPLFGEILLTVIGAASNVVACSKQMSAAMANKLNREARVHSAASRNTSRFIKSRKGQFCCGVISGPLAFYGEFWNSQSLSKALPRLGDKVQRGAGTFIH
jgi:hypothetical protein